MQTIEEVHIAPLGHERDRIVQPLRKHGADTVYLIEDVEHGGRDGYHDEMIAALREDGIEVGVGPMTKLLARLFDERIEREHYGADDGDEP